MSAESTPESRNECPRCSSPMVMKGDHLCCSDCDFWVAMQPKKPKPVLTRLQGIAAWVVECLSHAPVVRGCSKETFVLRALEDEQKRMLDRVEEVLGPTSRHDIEDDMKEHP